MRSLTLADLRLALGDLLTKRTDALQTSAVGKAYSPYLQKTFEALEGEGEKERKLPFTKELWLL